MPSTGFLKDFQVNTFYLVKVRRLFIHPLAPKRTARHNMRAWVRSVRILGSAWVGKPQPLS